jgi:4'-phosphopantetheinyl transferase
MDEANCRRIIPDHPEMISHAYALPVGSVDVWSISLDRTVEDRDWDVLESSERSRAHRFRKAIDCDRYVVCRSFLRKILGSYLDLAPDRFEFAYGKHGKPVLPGTGLHFNVSHAGGKALVAVTWAGPVGVDLEPETRTVDVDRFAQAVCSQSERAQISNLPVAERCLALLRIWVAKEAFLKSSGEGLSRQLSGLEVAELSVCFIDPIPGFVSALALPSSGLSTEAS